MSNGVSLELPKTTVELMDVVIPAGGAIDAAYQAAIGSAYRPLAPIGDARTPVMQLVVDALRASGAVRNVIAVAPAEVRPWVSGVDRWIDARASGAENILAGLEAAETPMALVCASDLPKLQAASIAAFARRIPRDADIALGLVAADDFNRAYADAPPSVFVSLRGLPPVTIGCLFAVRPRTLTGNRALLDTAFAARKSQWRMARILGPNLTWRFLTRTLTLPAIVGRAEAILRCRAAVLENSAPNLAFDIDAVEDYQYANAGK